MRWYEKAKTELESLVELDIRYADFEPQDYDTSFYLEALKRQYDKEDRWLICKNEETALVLALEQAQIELEDLEQKGDIPEFLNRFYYVSPSNIKLAAKESAEQIVKDIPEDQLLAESGLRADFDDIDSKLDELSIEFSKSGNKETQYKMKDLEMERDALITKAVDSYVEDLEIEISKELDKDPIKVIVEHNLNRSMLTFDFGDAAKFLVDSEGVSAILDSVDGLEIKLPSGALAFGIK